LQCTGTLVPVAISIRDADFLLPAGRTAQTQTGAAQGRASQTRLEGTRRELLRLALRCNIRIFDTDLTVFWQPEQPKAKPPSEFAEPPKPSIGSVAAFAKKFAQPAPEPAKPAPKPAAKAAMKVHTGPQSK
jgi:hypothetical protein